MFHKLKGKGFFNSLIGFLKKYSLHIHINTFVLCKLQV